MQNVICTFAFSRLKKFFISERKQVTFTRVFKNICRRNIDCDKAFHLQSSVVMHELALLAFLQVNCDETFVQNNRAAVKSAPTFQVAALLLYSALFKRAFSLFSDTLHSSSQSLFIILILTYYFYYNRGFQVHS